MSGYDRSEYGTMAPDVEWEIAQEAIHENVISRLAGETLASGLPLNSRSTVLEAFRVVKSGPATLFGFTVLSTLAGAQFVQWFDAVSLPGNGAVPEGVINLLTSGDRAVSWVIPGRFFSRGIVLANSTTAATLTLGAANCFWDAQYV